MDRVVHKSDSHEEAAKWDVRQQHEMTPNERMAVAKKLIDQYYGKDMPDVRESGVWEKRKISGADDGSLQHNFTFKNRMYLLNHILSGQQTHPNSLF